MLELCSADAKLFVSSFRELMLVLTWKSNCCLSLFCEAALSTVGLIFRIRTMPIYDEPAVPTNCIAPIWFSVRDRSDLKVQFSSLVNGAPRQYVEEFSNSTSFCASSSSRCVFYLFLVATEILSI